MLCSTSGDNLFWFFQYEAPIPSSGDNRDGWEEHSRKEEEGFKATLLGFLADIHTSWGTFLRDVFLLSRLLAAAPDSSLSTIFEKFDCIRRPQVQKFFKFASKRGEERRKTGIWAQRTKEFLIGIMLWFSTWMNLHMLGIGEGDLVYDIDEALI
jgi:hypothetical protein